MLEFEVEDPVDVDVEVIELTEVEDIEVDTEEVGQEDVESVKW